MTYDSNLYDSLLGGYRPDSTDTGGAGSGDAGQDDWDAPDPVASDPSAANTDGATGAVSPGDLSASHAVSQTLMPLAVSALQAPPGTLTKDSLVDHAADFLTSVRARGALSDAQFGQAVKGAIDFLSPFDDDTPDPVLRAATGQVLANHLDAHGQVQAMADAGAGAGAGVGDSGSGTGDAAASAPNLDYDTISDSGPIQHATDPNILKVGAPQGVKAPSGGRAQRQAPPDPTAAADWAISHVGDGSYAILGATPGVGGQTGKYLGGRLAPKCNVFVHDALTAAGAEPKLADGSMPRAHDWFDAGVDIPGYDIVANSKDGPLDPLKLQSGDVISDGHHVGVYVPKLILSPRDTAPPGYSPRQLTRTDNVADGERWIQGNTISAASINSGHGNPFLGGPVWGRWGLRSDQSGPLVVRRMRRGRPPS